MKRISAPQAAKLLGITIEGLAVLEKKGLLHATHNTEGSDYSSDEIEKIKSRRNRTLSEEALQVSIGIQREMVSSLGFTRKVLTLIGGAFLGYILLLVVFAVLFTIRPLQTAQWLGIIKNTSLSLTQENPDERVLGVGTSVKQERNSPIVAMLQPIGKASLELVKNISPDSYTQVSKVAILDPNEVLMRDSAGALVPAVPLKVTSSLLEIPNSELITNLNSQYVQGKKPGTNTGDLAVIGVNGQIDGLLSPTSTPVQTVTSIGNLATFPTPTPTFVTTTPTTSGLTNANLSGSAGITNANLANSTITILGGNGIVVSGGSVSLGGSVTISNAAISGLTVLNFNSANISQWTNDSAYITSSSTDILTNKTISVLTNTISGLTNANLSGNAGITNANLAHPSLSLAGNLGSGTVSLGGALVLRGAGITNVTASGSTFTLNSTEADTLQSVYERSNSIKTKNGEGIIIDSSEADVTETVNGLKIDAPKTIPRTGTFNSLNLGTSTSSTENAYDQATIVVGNIANTAQQNFSTLNIQNGGTGYLDVELIKGFINFQGMNTLYDDFTGRSLDTSSKWNPTSTGTGSNCSMLAGGLNGLFRMHSGGGANRGCELTTQAITSLMNGYYQRGNNPIFETKIKIDVVTNARIFAGFTGTRVAASSETNPGTNHAYIVKRASDTTWQCVTDDGGITETTVNTHVRIISNTFYRLRVELRSGTIPETICTIDDGTTVTRTVVTSTQPDSTKAMDVYVKLNQSDAVVKNMDVDYVRAWQDDSPEMALNSNGDLASTSVDSNATNDSIAEEMPTLPSITPIPEEEVESDALTDLLTKTVSSLFQNLAEFFGRVIFHADVTFLGRPMFNRDTAGHALIKAGDDEVEVIFEKEYAQNPVVTADINLVGAVKPDELPNYAIYDSGTKGFKIKLSRVTASDLSFSWVALAISVTDSAIKETISSPTPSVSTIPIIQSITEIEASPSSAAPVTTVTPSAEQQTSTQSATQVSPTP